MGFPFFHSPYGKPNNTFASFPGSYIHLSAIVGNDRSEMGNGDDDHNHDVPVEDRDAIARQRMRKLQLLQRIGAALGVPIDEFYTPISETDTAKVKPNGDEQG